MNWTKRQLIDYYLQRVQAGDKESGTGAVLQKLKADSVQSQDKEAIHMHRQKEKAMDGSSYPQFRVTITYFVSDRRRRDAWGMAETIADCLVSASRRLLGTDAAGRTARDNGGKGRRGLRDSGGKNQLG